MDKDVINVSDQDEEEEVNSTRNKRVSETKLWIENENLTNKCKIDDLRNKVLNLRKRQKGTDKSDSDCQIMDEESPPKRMRQDECSSSNSSVNIVEDSSSSNSKPSVLPSFKPMTEVTFESVIKNTQPSLLETKYTDDVEDSKKYEKASTEIGSTRSQHLSNNSETVEVLVETPRTTRLIDFSTKHRGKQPRESYKDREMHKERPEQREEEPQPLVKVIFRDEELARMFRKAVHEALVEVFAVEDPEIDESDHFPGLQLNIWEQEIPEETPDLSEPNSLFKLDTAPVKTAFNRRLPKYNQTFNNVLQMKPREEEAKKEGAGSQASSCFNCEGSHMLSDCPKPIDNTVVSRNRGKYMNNRKVQQKSSRYHIDEEQRFAHLVPGKISNELRAALGLNHNQLPRYVYRMRKFGYPPGWLEEAKVTHSGICLINESSSGVQDVSFAAEEDCRDTYDVSKIVEYPGFNIPLSDNTSYIDESRRHQCPPMQWNHSKDSMINEIGSSATKGYNKKKKSRNSVPGDDTVLTNDDMEVVQIDDEVMIVLDSTADSEIQEEQAIKEDEATVSHPLVDAVLSQDSNSMPPSPSLAMLEAHKRSILNELEGSNSSSPRYQPGTPTSPVRVSSIDNAVTSTPEPSLGRTKSLSVGTPVLDSHSPFSNLPSADKFSQGISDHLNFENLPDATGKYEKMKSIINKVRHIVDAQQDNDS